MIVNVSLIYEWMEIILDGLNFKDFKRLNKVNGLVIDVNEWVFDKDVFCEL